MASEFTKLSPIKEPIKVLGEVIQAELELADGAIMLGLENWAIPKDKGIYVALLYGPDKVIGNNNTSREEDGVFLEVQETAMLHEIIVDLMSFDKSARERKEEVIMAFNSTRAQVAMEAAGMRFGSLPRDFTAVPDLEPAKLLNRFRATVSVYALHVRTRPQPYFDKFNQRQGFADSVNPPEVIING